MNVVGLFKALDALMVLRDAAKRFTSPAEADDTTTPSPPPQGVAGQIEARLTNVVVAALKEAFDRDQARLDIERSLIDEQRRRAEEALRLELRRQAADRELARLRLLAGIAMIGWIASVVMLGVRLGATSTPARAVLAAGWLLLLGSLASAFTAQGRVGQLAPDEDRTAGAGFVGAAALWLLIAGLGVTAMSLLL